MYFTLCLILSDFVIIIVAYVKRFVLKIFRITLRVRKLLLLIPTDPAIQEALDQLDSLGRKVQVSSVIM